MSSQNLHKMPDKVTNNNKPGNHKDSFFEMSKLYYFWLLIDKDKGYEISTLTTIYIILYNNVNTMK